MEQTIYNTLSEIERCVYCAIYSSWSVFGHNYNDWSSVTSTCRALQNLPFAMINMSRTGDGEFLLELEREFKFLEDVAFEHLMAKRGAE